MRKRFNITNLFWQAEEESKVEPTQEAAPVAAPVEPVRTAVVGTPDEAIAKSLSEAIEQADIPGFDYLEFAKMVEALKQTIPAEATQYQTAYTSATAFDKTVTADKLISTASVYLDALKAKEEVFLTVYKNKYDETVVGKEKEISLIQAKVEEKAKAIELLNDEINLLSTKKIEIANKISQDRGDLEQVHTNFKATLDMFVGKISSDVEKIKKYLPPKEA